ncbi:acetyltransferase [Campylobacter sp. MIT 12-8780]|uniref:AAC(3) family N-acetyltransferase n=1 Tax=unclassified Campylobacter TaxID=2593542 RepID=UPI0010F7AA52|nr:MULTISPECIES: AAC(3) family N-acetyltransferase [unclassified Campylobacter]NDJ26712.1 aminoglycoside N(3)-acetyltransferase [Campylobacter sp. MIT 19-121]TKX30213.1 acetyltransferase [Campylobacter sp. MIT 12-5580]TQR42463.1 acetyltransferase [Campylobacter sp. MIT 12-8780]
MRALFKAKNKLFYDEDFKTCLEKLGVQKDDILCVHTQLFNFGEFVGKKEDFLNALISSFEELLGKNGTLIMPTFSYSFCKNQPFDIQKTPSTMGILTEHFRKMPGVKRSLDPIFSFAIKGKDEKDFLKPCKSCFDKDSVYGILLKKAGKILLLGTKELGFTFTHFVEEQVGVKYRYFKEFKGQIIDENSHAYEASIKYFVRALDKNSNLSVQKQVSLLKKDDNFKSLDFANSSLTLIAAQKYFQSVFKALKQDENALLEDTQ